MMKGMTNRINCDDAKAASAAHVCVLSCRFASNAMTSPNLPASPPARSRHCKTLTPPSIEPPTTALKRRVRARLHPLTNKRGF